MKKLFLISAIVISSGVFAQETPEAPKTPEPEKTSDTTRFNLKNVQVILVSKEDVDVKIDTIDAAPPVKIGRNEAHWAGLDFGFNMLTDGNGGTKFPGYKYWENDPAHSIYFNVNFAEKKIKIIQEYVGITTGIGFNFNQVAFNNNYVLMDSVDTIVGVISPQNYSKNKLRAAYLQIPILLEFNTNKDNDKGVYLAAGVIGGVRLSSRVKRVGEIDGDKFIEKTKGTYALNPFKCDLTARVGYGDFGAFVNYSVLPLFNTDKTTEVYPVTFGVSLNF
ncbi:MAG: porin family protein [Bacteroidota bacterium]